MEKVNWIQAVKPFCRCYKIKTVTNTLSSGWEVVLVPSFPN